MQRLEFKIEHCLIRLQYFSEDCFINTSHELMVVAHWLDW